jgi:hypothetical protein
MRYEAWSEGEKYVCVCSCVVPLGNRRRGSVDEWPEPPHQKERRVAR